MGAMRAEIPFTSLCSQAVSLTLDETLITIRPRSTPLQDAVQGSADRGPAVPAGTHLIQAIIVRYQCYNCMGNSMLSCFAAGQSICLVHLVPFGAKGQLQHMLAMLRAVAGTLVTLVVP